MKKVWALLSLSLFLVAGMASAESRQNASKKALVDEVSGQGYGTAGCGLGSIVFGSKPGIIQVVAVTLNSLWGNQTFGITSGTSNCVSEEEARKAELFIETNRLALEDDISRGQGETLANLSELLGCGSNEKLGASLQKNFERIFPSRATSTESITHSIYATISEDSELANACLNVG